MTPAFPRIDRYMLRLFLTLFGFFALVLVSVYWINQAVRLFEQLLRDGQTALVVLEFTALTLPYVISIVLPVAAFAATAYGTNRLSGESELVAMQAAGLSPWRLARPVLVFGLLVALMVAVLVHALVPMSRARLADRQAEVAENVTAQFLRPGIFQFPADGLTLFIGEISDQGELLNLFLEDSRDSASQTTYTAEKALLVRSETGPKLVMIRGAAQVLRAAGDGPRLSVTRFADLTYDIGASLGARAARGRELRDYSTPALLAPSASLLSATGKTAAEARRAAHDRIAQPLLSPVAAMIGFATLLIGGYSRFGVWRQVVLAILLLIVVQFLTNAMQSQTAKTPDLWALLYLPALAGAGMGAVMLWLAAKPRRVKGTAA